MLKDKISWCLKDERRVKRISFSDDLSQEHIKKAKHNLHAADYNLQGGFDDWVISQIYYAVYHSLLAILFKKGFELKNHECTITLIEEMILTKQINLTEEDISFIRTTEQMTPKDAKSLREEFQYGIKTKVDKILLLTLIKKSKEIVEKVEIDLNK